MADRALIEHQQLVRWQPPAVDVLPTSLEQGRVVSVSGGTAEVAVPRITDNGADEVVLPAACMSHVRVRVGDTVWMHRVGRRRFQLLIIGAQGAWSGWEPLHAETITGPTNFPIEPGVYEQLRVSLVGTMDSTPGFPLLLLNDTLGSSDYRTAGYVVNTGSGAVDSWSDEQTFWRPGMISTATGSIEATIYGDATGGVSASGFKRFRGKSFRNVATAARLGDTAGATQSSVPPVDRIRISQSSASFGAIDELRVTIEGLRL